MKTTKQLNNSKENFLLNSCSKIIILLMIYLTTPLLSISQNYSDNTYQLGAGAGITLTGNGHGAIYEGGLNLSNNHNMFLANLCLQKRNYELCGSNISYIRNLNFNKEDYENTDCKSQLFIFSKIQYIHKAKLSYKTQQLEENFFAKKNDYLPDYNKYRLSTLEAYIGFGMNINIYKNLDWHNSIGFGTFYHLNYNEGMYKDRISPALLISTSLRLKSFK